MNEVIKHAPAKDSPYNFPERLKYWRSQRRLSQMAFSLDVGISQKHLSFMESGRSRPSREMVLQLARTLELGKRETNELLRSAGFAHVFEQRAINSKQMTEVNKVLQMMLKHHEPYPALVADRNWNMLMSNDAAHRLIGMLGDRESVWQNVDPSGSKNVYRMTFSEHGFRPFIANWFEVEASLIQRLHREISADPDNEALLELLNELVTESGAEEQKTEWLFGAPPVLPLSLSLGGVELKLFSVISSFGAALDVTADELKVETFFPADEASADFLKQLV